MVHTELITNQSISLLRLLHSSSVLFTPVTWAKSSRMMKTAVSALYFSIVLLASLSHQAYVWCRDGWRGATLWVTALVFVAVAAVARELGSLLCFRLADSRWEMEIESLSRSLSLSPEDSVRCGVRAPLVGSVKHVFAVSYLSVCLPLSLPVRCAWWTLSLSVNLFWCPVSVRLSVCSSAIFLVISCCMLHSWKRNKMPWNLRLHVTVYCAVMICYWIHSMIIWCYLIHDRCCRLNEWR